MEAQLIQRLKENLEWLAGKMPEKFYYALDCFVDEKSREVLVSFDDQYGGVFSDPQREFSNSLGRIVWVAFGQILTPSIYLDDDVTNTCVRIEQERGKK